MKLSRTTLVCLLLVGVMALPLLGQREPEHNDTGGSTGGSGTCNYCSQSACGCSPPPLGTTLSFSCTCSSLQCTKSCNYSPN